MSFTEDQLLAVAKVLKMNIDSLRAHTIYRGELVTSAIVSDVMTQVTAYGSVANTGVEFYPTESNRGFKKTINSQRSEFQDNIRVALGLGQTGNRLLRG